MLAPLVAAFALAALPSTAPADDFSPNQPALDQYVESLPVAEGNKAPSRHTRSVRLPRATVRALPHSADGRLLEHLASSPAAGAPTAGTPQPTSGAGRGAGSGGRKGSPGRPIAAGKVEGGSLASAAVEGAGGGAGLLLLLLLGGIGAAAVVARSRARRGQ